MFKTIKSLFKNNTVTKNQRNSLLYGVANAIWMERNYREFAEEAYIKNVVAHRAINMIANSAASVPLTLQKRVKGRLTTLDQHPILNLLRTPNVTQNGKEFLEAMYTYKQINGNAFVLMVANNNEPLELYNLRPDRITIISGPTCVPMAYRYEIEGNSYDYPVDSATGHSDILHLKTFHPLSDWYGLSSIEAAAYSIDQHNNAGKWNQALLQNGARPSGAIIVKDASGNPAHLNNEQYQRIKNMVEENFTGAQNAGRPMLLEGGLEWQEMSLSPKDMDFIASKHSSARDIALALGVPPQLLGIPGDNTYSNLIEARIAFWEQTVIPLLENTVEHFGNWLSRFYNEDLILKYDIDSISALSHKRDAIWERVQKADFMTINEKRAAVGLSPITGGDTL